MAEYERITARGLLFDVRPGTSDAQAIKEVVEQHGYTRRWFQIEPGERWLDLGANIGAFSVLAASCGASVDAYEAEPANAALAVHNVALNHADATVHHAAVVADAYPGDTMPLYLSNTAYGLWRHSLYKTKNRRAIQVPVKRIGEILSGVDGVKMDIEGAEIDILYALDDFRSVKKFCFEYHFDVNSSVALFRHIIGRLSQHFSRVQAGKIPEGVEEYTFYPPARVVLCAK
jgi:FkbM family methyltransferase